MHFGAVIPECGQLLFIGTGEVVRPDASVPTAPKRAMDDASANQVDTIRRLLISNS